MDEGGRYLRYIIPGVASIVQLLILILISGVPISASELISAVSANNGIGVAFTVLIASGGLGYLLAQMYFGLRAVSWFDQRFHQDYRQFFIVAHSAKLLRVIRVDKETGDENDKEKDHSFCPRNVRTSWELFNCLWHWERRKDSEIEKVDWMTGKLTGHIHALGATLAGVAFAFVVWLLILLPGVVDSWDYISGQLHLIDSRTFVRFCCNASFMGCLIVIEGVGLVWVVWRAFKSTLDAQVNITTAAMINDLERECRNTWKPVKFYWPGD